MSGNCWQIAALGVTLRATRCVSPGTAVSAAVVLRMMHPHIRILLREILRARSLDEDKDGQKHHAPFLTLCSASHLVEARRVSSPLLGSSPAKTRAPSMPSRAMDTIFNLLHTARN